MTDLSARRAAVTGGAQGIGRAAAVALASAGANVAVLDQNYPGACEVAEEIGRAGGTALALEVDVSEEDSVEAATATIRERWDGLDILVANAGIQLVDDDARVDALDLGAWTTTLAVNLTGMFLTCKHGIRLIRASRSAVGSVICTGSRTGLLGVGRGYDAYSASKAGVIGLMRVMAAEYAPEGIRVNAIIPGYITTAMGTGIPQERVDEISSRIPLRRPGTPEDVAPAFVFLASDEARYVTGSLLFVDGGLTAV